VLLSEINLLKIAALNKNILVHNNVPSATRVYADRDHVKIIFRNLLSNAIKFTQPGGKVEVNVVPSTAAGFITFVVKDSGVGMDAEQQKRIFDSVSESKPGTANEAGNSIGLMLCKSFVEENGGTIWVDSHPDKGSSFYFTLKAGTPA
jgi:signal transduction histidine kinase